MNTKGFICGVIEGFYGRPWSAAQRRQLFAWMKSWGLNAYFYAPKDDLKHRLLWRELYSDSQAEELKALIRDCRKSNAAFIYAIAPGLDLSYSSRKDLSRLRRKAEQLIDLGCRDFAILFDDIPPALSQGDSRRFDSLAAAQSAVTNALLLHLRRRIPDARLFFCPTHYCNRMSGPPQHSDYLKKIGKLLDPSIEIFWTGPEIVSRTITVESVRELRRVLQRKPVLWDNLHANDYDRRRIYLGPYSGRRVELREEVAGILSNPNCEFEANYIPLRTLSLFAHARGNWNEEKAYRAALKDWWLRWKACHGLQITPRELEFLCDCFYLPFEHGSCAASFIEDVNFLLRTPSKNWRKAALRFERNCSDILRLFDRIAALKNRELLYAIYGPVWDLKDEAVLLRKYLNWLKNGPRPQEIFTSPEHRPGIYRGGLVADLRRLLPMDDEGRFRRRPQAEKRRKDDASRAV